MGSTQVLIFEVPKGKPETWETSQMVQSQTESTEFSYGDDDDNDDEYDNFNGSLTQRTKEG